MRKLLTPIEELLEPITPSYVEEDPIEGKEICCEHPEHIKERCESITYFETDLLAAISPNHVVEERDIIIDLFKNAEERPSEIVAFLQYLSSKKTIPMFLTFVKIVERLPNMLKHRPSLKIPMGLFKVEIPEDDEETMVRKLIMRLTNNDEYHLEDGMHYIMLLPVHSFIFFKDKGIKIVKTSELKSEIKDRNITLEEWDGTIQIDDTIPAMYEQRADFINTLLVIKNHIWNGETLTIDSDDAEKVKLDELFNKVSTLKDMIMESDMPQNQKDNAENLFKAVSTLHQFVNDEKSN